MFAMKNMLPLIINLRCRDATVYLGKDEVHQHSEKWLIYNKYVTITESTSCCMVSLPLSHVKFLRVTLWKKAVL